MIPDLGGQMDKLVSQLWECDVRYRESVREFKRRFITRVLIANDNNQVAAAETLGMHRNTLARTIVELKIQFKHRGPGSGERKPRPQPALRMLEAYQEAEQISARGVQV